MNKPARVFLSALLFTSICIPQLSLAATSSSSKGEDLKVAGWIPYWSVKAGTKSALKHIRDLDAVYPFVYTVKQDGTLKDNGKITSYYWRKLFKEAKRRDVDVIPTVTSGDKSVIESILLDPKLRKSHIKEIVKVVEKGDFDGIDIDYENRSKASINEFSLFLKELKDALGDKQLVCTLEPRTPADSLWKTPPDPIPYSNDYDEIKKHCDVIQIMTYDQQRADIKLNEEKAGQPYFPNADIDWVEKVADLADDSLPKDKLMLGVPTYGRHMEVTVAPNWFKNYVGLGAVNEPGALKIAKDNKVKPSVNRAGEKVVTYIPKETDSKVARAIKSMKVPKDTPSGMEAALQALAYADKTGETVIVNMVWWSDADAIEEKVELAKDEGWRGIAIFKIDGQEDSDIWKLF